MRKMIYSIKDRHPVFPCRVWSPVHICWVTAHIPEAVTGNDTHWSPGIDGPEPTAPQVRPDAPTQIICTGGDVEFGQKGATLTYNWERRPASTPSPAAIAAAREIHSPLADIEAVRRTAAIIDRHFPAQSQAQGEK